MTTGPLVVEYETESNAIMDKIVNSHRIVAFKDQTNTLLTKWKVKSRSWNNRALYLVIAQKEWITANKICFINCCELHII